VSTFFAIDYPEPPQCGQCRRRVDRFERYRDELAREYVMVARCHGDTETVRVPDEAALEVAGFGDAFSSRPRGVLQAP
jgi:hypothetical protein